MTDMTVAQTILEQLGGRRFTMMTGAKHYTASDNTLSFGIARKGVLVRLDASDTYTVEVRSIRSRKIVATESNVYAEDLQRVFTKLTGLVTHL